MALDEKTGEQSNLSSSLGLEVHPIGVEILPKPNPPNATRWHYTKVTRTIKVHLL